MANCNCKNGSDVLDFLTPAPGGTATDATYIIGLTHYTCGGRKMLAADPTHPVVGVLTATPVGAPIDLGNSTLCQECLVSGTITYKPCNGCEPRTEYVSQRVCLPCSTTASPTLTIGNVAASPKPINYYQSNGCGCCAGTYPCTNQVAVTTSVNVTTA